MNIKITLAAALCSICISAFADECATSQCFEKLSSIEIDEAGKAEAENKADENNFFSRMIDHAGKAYVYAVKANNPELVRQRHQQLRDALGFGFYALLDKDEVIHPASKYEQFQKAALTAMSHDKGSDIAFAAYGILAASAICQGKQRDFKASLSGAKNAATEAGSPADYKQLITDLKLTQCGKKNIEHLR